MGIRSLSAELAELDVCSLDDAVVTGPNGEIVNDDISLSRIVETMRLEDGRWKWTERNGSRVTTEQCPGF